MQELDRVKLKKAFYEYINEEDYLDKTKEEVLGDREKVHEEVKKKLERLDLKNLSPDDLEETVYREIFAIFSLVEQESYQPGAQHYLSFFGAQRYHEYKDIEEADTEVKEKYPGDSIDENILKLRDLLYASDRDELEDAYNDYCSIDNIGHNNPSAFLMYTKPEEFIMTNNKTKDALSKLGVEVSLGEHIFEEYQQVLDAAGKIIGIIKNSNIARDGEMEDYIKLDWFFHNVGANNIPQDEKKVWFEKTRSDSHSEKEGWRFGECLASPQENSAGRDVYNTMRKCIPGDAVVHYLKDRDEIVGTSTVSDTFEEVSQAPQDKDNDWAGRPAYRVPVIDYRELEVPLPQSKFLTDRFSERLNEAYENRGERKIVYDYKYDHREGAYLTGVPPAFQSVLNQAYVEESGEPLDERLKQPSVNHRGDEELVEAGYPRYWMLHPGEGQKYWDKWQNDDYIAIGGEEVDSSKGNIDEQIEENFPEESASYVESIAHRFVDEMKEGDIVLVCGNSKVLKVAEVTSDLYVEGSGDKHRRKVKWLTEDPIDITDFPDKFHNKVTNQQTILEFSSEKNIELIKNRILQRNPESPEPAFTSPKEIISERNNSKIAFDDFDVTTNLHFPTNMGEQINESVRSALKSGKHIIFTGPPGTGKTKVARNTADFITENNDIVDDYIFTTATADWTTFDTIGGYHPSKEKEGLLKFKAGQFLKCFREDREDNDNGTPVNKWLIIDEINRADIDKAFGQLFSVLSNDSVELPFTDEDGKSIDIISLDEGEEFDYSDSNYYVTSNWRLLATMNTYDKASLYEMSYAFMRRFAFIDVGVPTDQIGVNLIRDYMAKWEEVSIEEVRSHLEDLADMWRVLNEGKRSIGPAIIKDMLLFLQENNGEDGLLNALKLYVLPQLEGMVKQNQKDVLSALGEELELQEEMPRVAKQRFEIDLTAGNE